MHKGVFVDALCLRYGWLPARTPSHCVCGASFSVEHALSCPRGGFPSIRHKEIRDLTANLLTKVCNDVRVEPDLQELTGEVMSTHSSNISEGVRLDIAINGFWGGSREKTFSDVRVFNPHAPSNRQSSITQSYRRLRAYERRIREVEHASFTPLVLSACGGLATGASTFYKRLASLLAEKWEQPYSITISWLRCTLSFSLLRSAIQCIRGARSRCGLAAMNLPLVDLVSAEANISL